MSIDIYSVIPLLLLQLAGSEIIGNATGFLWNDAPNSQYYLVTNYHVLSGINPYTDEVTDANGRTPSSIRVFHNSSKLGEWRPIDYPVVNEDGTPKWREHPNFGRKVDVVLLAIDIPSDYVGYAINDQKWVDLLLRPAENVSIIGFPRGETAGGLFCIWQTGYISSEPELDYSGMPCLLVDSKAWPGNSGSPVIARRYGSWSLKDGSQGFGSGNGFVTDFVGIFSMSVGQAEMKFVWKRSVIEDILR